MDNNSKIIAVKKVNDLITDCREQKDKALQAGQSLKAVKLEGEMDGYRNIRYLLEHNLL